MASNFIIVALGVVFLSIIFQEIEGSGGISILIPQNRRIIGDPAKKCLVYAWDGVCENQNCTVQIVTVLSDNHNSFGIFSSSFKPFTKDNYTQGVCIYDSSLTADCCKSFLNGTEAKSPQSIRFSTYEKISFTLHRERMGQSIMSENTFVLPWKDVCLTNDPCKPYGKCVANEPNEYNCTCDQGWENRNCTGYTGWTVLYGKCLKDAKLVKKIEQGTVGECKTTCELLNIKEKIGCKSFDFLPSTAGECSKTGECRLFDVSNKHDGTEIVNCPKPIQMTFEMNVLPKVGRASALVAVSSFAVLINLALVVFMLM